MFLNPLLGYYIRPILFNWINQTRGIRPTIKIGKERFQLSLDVKQFKKDELKIKARPEYVIIEGKQERKSEKGYSIRQFVRKYKLPHGCDPSTIKTSLSADGILTVVAPRSVCDVNTPCETVVPITFTESKDESLAAVQNQKAKNDKT